MKTHEIYQYVTDKIINLLENHMQDWKRPWISFGQDNDYARNLSTNRYYRGVNQFILSFELMEKGYLKNIWMTFNQIKSQDGHVRKGESSLPIIFYKTAYIDQNKKYYKPETLKTMSVPKAQELGIKSIPVLKL